MSLELSRPPVPNVEVITDGKVIPLHFLDGQVIQQGHNVAAAFDVGPYPQITPQPAFHLVALRGVALQTLVQNELRLHHADTFPDADRIGVQAKGETLDKPGRPDQPVGISIRFFRRQVRVATLQKVVLGGR